MKTMLELLTGLISALILSALFTFIGSANADWEVHRWGEHKPKAVQEEIPPPPCDEVKNPEPEKNCVVLVETLEQL